MDEAIQDLLNTHQTKVLRPWQQHIILSHWTNSTSQAEKQNVIKANVS